MRVRFWGTRGSIATAGPHTVRYGGNTSCVEVRSSSGELVILDCGTGAQHLGRALLEAREAPLRGHILITHTHWDHIQGLPFFQPLFVAGNEWHVYGPRGLGPSLRETLAAQMQYTYFPVTLEQLAATVHYHDLVEGAFEIGDVRVATQYLNHPALTLGYRLEGDGVCVVYATDHEPHARQLAEHGYRSTAGEDQRHARFLAGADLLIHDAQYTAHEYPAKQGWGHSTLEYVVDVALAMEVRRLALFHHDPTRDDAAMDRFVEQARARAAEAGRPLEVFAAAERLTLDLEPVARSRPATQRTGGEAVSTPAVLEHSVLVAVPEPASAGALSEAVRADDLPLLVAGDGNEVLRVARAERPSLLVLGCDLPGASPTEICRTIRREEGAWGGEVPVVLVAEKEGEVDPRAASAAGVTDWLVRPFSSQYARTRLRAWLLRAACRWVKAPLPEDEPSRLRGLHELSILDTEPEERFDRYTRIAAALFRVPIALVSLVDADRQWFKSRQGLDATETPREMAFCAHAILRSEVFLVPDALQDPRFAENPLVTGPPHVRFYAGVPLALPDGSRVGTLCLIDHRPRQLDEAELAILRDLGRLVERELAARPA